MADIETYLKWGIIGGISIFAIYIVYQFATKQGWLTYRQRLTRMRSYQQRFAGR